MSMTSNSSQNHTTPGPLPTTPGMAQNNQPRRSRPSHVLTSLPSNSQISHNLASALSTSSVTSGSLHESPIMFPETGLTTNTSVQPSPEQRGRGVEQFAPPPLQLPESVLSRKPSSTSLGQSVTSTPSSGMKGGLIRRASNRATKVFSRRRPSSVAPTSRDGSVQAIYRRRSDSNTTAPPDVAEDALEMETEDETHDEKGDDGSSFLYGDGIRDCSTSPPASVAGSGPLSVDALGPVVHNALIQGTPLLKVKRNKRKIIVLQLDNESAKLSWDKNKPSKCIYIDDIKEIRKGSDIRQYVLEFGVDEADQRRFFTIIYADANNSKTKMMHLVAGDDGLFEQWTEALDAISKYRQDFATSLMAFDDNAIRVYWQMEMSKQSADKIQLVGEEEIDFPGVERVCRNLHIHLSQEQLQRKFDAADSTRTKRLNFSEFQDFVRLTKRRDDIREIYLETATHPENGLSCDEFLSFLRDVQGEKVEADTAYWESVFSRNSRRLNKSSRELESKGVTNVEHGPRMPEEAFANFLNSTYQLPLVREPEQYVLDRPITDYFISSSHNTYLMGRQIRGYSCVEGYISALIGGCRCVEVDCWDGPDGQPIVVHGRTLTTTVPFREVINTINKYAFVKSRFPLWISLEVHCNAQQQTIMASIMREIFGSKLVTERLDTASDRLPSPSELLDCILVKAKQPQQLESKNGDSAGRRRGSSLTSPYAKPVVLDNSSVPAQYLPNSPLLSPNTAASKRANHKMRVNTITEGEVHEGPSSSNSDCESAPELPARKKSSKIVPALGDLAVYCVGIKFRGFETPEAKKFNHIFSFVEATFHKNNKPKEQKRALFRHNMKYLMRVYPNQMRITSTNFDPLVYWKHGVQMAALNWQTFDLGMQINRAMFDAGTDQSGYVLKPPEFREIQVKPDFLAGKRERMSFKFSIDVISAQQLMRPYHLAANKTVDPYVEVEVFLADDKRDKTTEGFNTPEFKNSDLKFRTEIVRDNGFNPTFKKRMEFNVTTKYPDLVFVRWSVRLASEDKNKEPLATFTAKLSSLKQGYRTLPLLDPNGDRYLFSTLFCRIKLDPITRVYVACPEDEGGTESVNKLKSIFFTRGNPSPKASMDTPSSR